MQVGEILRSLGGLLLLPYVLYKEIRQEAGFWKTTTHVPFGGKRDETRELKELLDRLAPYAADAPQRRERVCRSVVQKVCADRSLPVAAAADKLLTEIVEYEGFLSVPVIDLKDRPLSTSEMWETAGALSRTLATFETPEILEGQLERLLGAILWETDFGEAKEEDVALSVPLYVLLPQLNLTLDRLFNEVLGEKRIDSPFFHLWPQLEQNLLTASGIDPATESVKQPVYPSQAKANPEELVNAYLADTPFIGFFYTRMPFSIPFASRIEHTHIVGGSGHGKTQLLQQMILKDLEKLEEGNGSVIVIDSQGDLLKNILSLALVGRISERLVLIDPNDIENPPALNLFDFGLERLDRYNAVEREKLLNSAIALYEYLFGALLGAELTQKQGVIFRYLARLMMTVPGATIHTLLEFMETPEAVRVHLGKLDQTSRHFFETQFFSRVFDPTRQQILTRLWGVLSNSVLERMLGNEKNRLDVFEAMNRGSLILINTAKDLLKQEGCEILGRFFITLISQAVQERAAIPEDRRRSTFVYIDEAQDYFDESIEGLFNQARKYKVGLVIAHQNLDQFEPRLRAGVVASTSIKLVGGLSAKDASAFAKEMNCEPKFLQGMRKERGFTEFACFVRNHTRHPIPLTVPFGQMERQEKLAAEELELVLSQNRRRYSATGAGKPSVSKEETLGRPDLL